jgi:hypothetical protein
MSATDPASIPAAEDDPPGPAVAFEQPGDAARRPLLAPGRRKAGRKNSKRRAFVQPSARPRTMKVYVASPSVPGAREHVERVVDPIEYLWRRGQLGDRPYEAAKKFREAFDGLVSVGGGAMDFERVRSGNLISSPLPRLVAAEEVITDTKKALYPVHFDIVCKCVGEGHLIKDVAPIFGMTIQDCSCGLKQALQELADRWIPLGARRDDRRRKINAHRDFDPRSLTSTSEQVVGGRVAHADRHGVKMGGSD